MQRKEGDEESFLCLHCSRHLSIFGDLTCLRDGPFKKWWVWWRGEGNVQFTRSYFFSSAISMNTFIRVRKSSFSSLLLLLFFGNIHIISLIFLQDIKNHSLHGVKFFSIQIHVIRNDNTRQGFIVTLRTMYEERSPSQDNTQRSHSRLIAFQSTWTLNQPFSPRYTWLTHTQETWLI